MSKLTAAIVAVVFATSAVAGPPAWSDRGSIQRDRGQPVNQFPAGDHREHPVRHVPVANHGKRDNRDNALILGLGVLAGAAILLAATDSKPVAYSTSVPVYVPPPAYYPPPDLGYLHDEPVVYLPSLPPATAYAYPRSQRSYYYCAQSAAYYPHARQCPRGWLMRAHRHPG